MTGLPIVGTSTEVTASPFGLATRLEGSELARKSDFLYLSPTCGPLLVFLPLRGFMGKTMHPLAGSNRGELGAMSTADRNLPSAQTLAHLRGRRQAKPCTDKSRVAKITSADFP